MKKKAAAFFCALFLLGLCACGGRGPESAPSGKVTLILGSFDEDAFLSRQIEAYNQAHTDVQIETRKYVRSDQPQKDGILKLQRETVSGEGPDLIDFGTGYSTSDVAGDYTEDLFSYLSPGERETYFENVLEAFSCRDGLYAIPLGFTLESLVGKAENLMGRTNWNIGEMMECYGSQKEERLLYPGAFQRDVFATLMTGSLDYYIDWETGKCSFSGTEFGGVLEFCRDFPARLELEEDFSAKQAFLTGEALLLPIRFTSVYDVCRAESIFDGQEVAYIGFPVEGVSGTILKPCGPVLAISRSSDHKEAAWDFIRWCLSASAQGGLSSGFPVCRNALEEQLAQAMEIEYETDQSGAVRPVAKAQVIFEGEDPAPIYCITQAQAQSLLELIGSAQICSMVDRTIYNILMEEAEYYFNGAKSLEEVKDVIQSRISMYVSERIG